jgi:hypothetical protein
MDCGPCVAQGSVFHVRLPTCVPSVLWLMTVTFTLLKDDDYEQQEHVVRETHQGIDYVLLEIDLIHRQILVRRAYNIFFFLKRIRPQWPVTVSLSNVYGSSKGSFAFRTIGHHLSRLHSGPFFAHIVSSYSCIGLCVLALN